MAHTEGRYQQDLGFTDGRIFAGPGDVVLTGTAPTLTSNAPGFTLNFPNSAASHIGVNLTQQIMRRTGFFEDLQEQFGGNGIPASAQPQFYRPDIESTYGVQMKFAQQLNPRTAFKTKGIRLVSCDVIYAVAGAAMTTNTIRADQIQYQNNLAPVTAAIVAPGANGLASAVQANPYVINVAPAFQNYATLPDATIWIDWTIGLGAGGTMVFYGFDILFEFNFN